MEESKIDKIISQFILFFGGVFRIKVECSNSCVNIKFYELLKLSRFPPFSRYVHPGIPYKLILDSCMTKNTSNLGINFKEWTSNQSRTRSLDKCKTVMKLFMPQNFQPPFQSILNLNVSVLKKKNTPTKNISPLHIDQTWALTQVGKITS